MQRPANILNFKILSLSGLANGTLLTRNYNYDYIRSYNILLQRIEIAYYTGASIIVQKVIEDNKIFTVSTTPQYVTLRPYTRINPIGLESLIVSSSIFNLFLDRNNLNLFSKNSSAFEKIDLNIVSGMKIADGLDMSINTSFCLDAEANTQFAPYVVVNVFVELISDLDKFYSELKND